MTLSIHNGAFVYQPDDESWQWSSGMFRLFGFEPGEVVPSRALIAHHLSGPDNERFNQLMADGLRGAVPVSRLHHINATDHRRTVVTALTFVDRDDGPILHGVTVDVTTELRAETIHQTQTDIARAIDSHHVIDQAQGILMLAYAMTAQQAFQLLRWLSQRHNTKVRVMAERVITATTETTRLSEPSGVALDRMLSDAVICRVDATASPPAPGEDGFRTEIRSECQSTTVIVHGVVNLAVIPALAETLISASRAHPRHDLIIDLSQVCHLASAGMWELVGFCRKTRQRRGQRVTVLPPQSPPPQWPEFESLIDLGSFAKTDILTKTVISGRSLPLARVGHSP